ncbi:hypothetical protein FK529_16270 [Tsukamurella asaccharolytica]|uniref:BcpO-related WXXGXW repeat protein n=2 Tax=Tsukamurella asaccharolytica TaxID=2592067 RepID=A0A5C5R6C6_9ACTN|nr:hypothetical protein FK529_16270 [Tsukamurella asaccharolytica]
MIGSALLGATAVGGLAAVGAGTAAAAPNPAPPGAPGAGQGAATNPAPRPAARPAPNQVPRQVAPQSNGQNPNWRPGPVYRQGAWHTPVWDQGRNHWGFWLGPIWIPVG